VFRWVKRWSIKISELDEQVGDIKVSSLKMVARVKLTARKTLESRHVMRVLSEREFAVEKAKCVFLAMVEHAGAKHAVACAGTNEERMRIIEEEMKKLDGFIADLDAAEMRRRVRRKYWV